MSDLPATINLVGQSVRGGQYISFRVGEELFGVNILCVEEIITLRKYTAIPRTPKYFLGIINLRGEVISIIDLRKRFQVEPQGSEKQNRIVVISLGAMKLGMLVDAIESITTVEDQDIQRSTHMLSSKTQQYLAGTYKLDEKQILLLLNQEKLINTEDFLIGADLARGTGGEVQTAEQTEEEERGSEIFLVGFSIGLEQFALESLNVEEIILMPEVIPLPEMEDFVEGIFHLRDSAIPVLRLSDKLEVQSTGEDTTRPVIIVKVFDVKVGLIVDQITEVYLIKEKEICDPPITLNPAQLEQLKGVIKQEREGKQQIVMLLALEKLFSDEEQQRLREIEQQQDLGEVEEDLEEETPILEFLLNDEKYAIPVFDANEIILERDIVPVPKAPRYILGVLNLRGEVISVVNLPLLVGRPKYEFSIHTRLLIVNPGHNLAALVVEKVVGIRKVKLSSFKPPSDLLTRRGNVTIRGMAQDEKTDDIVILLDVTKTLEQSQDNAPDEFAQGDLLSLAQELEQLDQEEALLTIKNK